MLWMCSSFLGTTASIVMNQGVFETPQTFNTFCLFLISALTSDFLLGVWKNPDCNLLVMCFALNY